MGTQLDEKGSARYLDKALARLIAELRDGLRHGHFELAVSCEIIGHEKRRLTLRVGKSYQFVIPKDECLGESKQATDDFCDGSGIGAK
jgi:hypothetical protein